MKAKKKLRSFRCTDSMWQAFNEAAKKEGMNVNEWLRHAAGREEYGPVKAAE